MLLLTLNRFQTLLYCWLWTGGLPLRVLVIEISCFAIYYENLFYFIWRFIELCYLNIFFCSEINQLSRGFVELIVKFVSQKRFKISPSHPKVFISWSLVPRWFETCFKWISVASSFIDFTLFFLLFDLTYSSQFDLFFFFFCLNSSQFYLLLLFFV